MDFTTAFIGDLLLEWLLSSRSSLAVHGRRAARRFTFFAIAFSFNPDADRSVLLQRVSNHG
jgi:hypothetical protein